LPHLHVSVRLNGTVVEDRLCVVDGFRWLGDADNALVAFPGGSLWVEHEDGVLHVKGVPLPLGQPLELQYGAVGVRLEATHPERLPRDWSWLPDPTLLVATAALVLAGAFADLMVVQWNAPRNVPVVNAEIERTAGRVQIGEAGYGQAVADTGRAVDAWPPTVTFQPE
jgi:hypothetical protein